MCVKERERERERERGEREREREREREIERSVLAPCHFQSPAPFLLYHSNVVLVQSGYHVLGFPRC